MKIDPSMKLEEMTPEQVLHCLSKDLKWLEGYGEGARSASLSNRVHGMSKLVKRLESILYPEKFN